MEGCVHCGFVHQCICEHIPSISNSAHFVLLTHSNELTRETNTGKLMIQTLEHCEIIEWQRKVPPQTLLKQIRDEQVQPFLVYPSEHSLPLTEVSFSGSHESAPALFIILDGTWQEAKKMMNKSEWLKTLPCVHLEVEQRSEYQLRRNQEDGHLCTCEVASKILEGTGQAAQANELTQYFEHYMAVFKADKSGHALKR